ncbi:MAG: alpha/beta hydrolase fold protein [Labilithrix sp.]|nr:alpha/beta hydrolase fold protein [Labilithrix sp.]
MPSSSYVRCSRSHDAFDVSADPLSESVPMTDAPTLHVFEAGAGPAVVFIHGLPSPPEELEALAADLPGMRVLVPHLPGYGKTPASAAHHGWLAVQAALVRALRARDVERPALVGYSMGAYRALSLAFETAARAVVCIGGFAELSAEERAGMAGFAGALRNNVDVRAILPERFLSAAHRARHPSDDAIVTRWIDAAPPHVLVEELEDVAQAPSLLHRLAQLECPVLARTGDLDLAVPATHARAIANAAKHGVLEIVAGAGHALFLEDREATLASIRRVCAA